MVADLALALMLSLLSHLTWIGSDACVVVLSDLTWLSLIILSLVPRCKLRMIVLARSDACVVVVVGFGVDVINHPVVAAVW